MRVSPFTVKMLTIHRWFDISAAERDLHYKPVYTFDAGWAQTLEWFKTQWLPTTPFSTSTNTAKPDSSKTD
jgi:nucleoside-diphosphate-sugar epimerase